LSKGNAFGYSELRTGREWSPPTKETRFEWTPQKAGAYTVEAQAIDRDLNYSEPAILKLKVVRRGISTAGFCFHPAAP
jgi:hypothetical protein